MMPKQDATKRDLEVGMTIVYSNSSGDSLYFGEITKMTAVRITYNKLNPDLSLVIGPNGPQQRWTNFTSREKFYILN